MLQKSKLQELLGDMRGYSEAETESMLEAVGDVIFEGVLLRVIEVLSEEEQDELTKLFEASSADPEDDTKRDAVLTYIAEHVPNFRGLIEEEVALLVEAEQAARLRAGPDESL